jgi:NAD(P)-dependent dehydrogenase (short-subunit alcohol dehydrogenase family)
MPNITNAMQGRVCIVTGSNEGIGKATALGLADMRATVVMACRDQTRGEAALNEVKAKSGNESVFLMVADLASQKSIRRFVDEFNQKFDKLHVLINNAGVSLSKRSVTEDGIEATFAINHLAPFLMTNLLLHKLKASAPSRVVTVSSSAHRWMKIDFDDLMSEKNYGGYRAYGRSKLANILFTYELARRLQGTNVTANCLHPGFVRTHLSHDNGGVLYILLKIVSPFLLSPQKGAETSIYLASSPEVANMSGKYFKKKRPIKSSKESYDESVAKRLWDVSEKLTKLSS